MPSNDADQTKTKMDESSTQFDTEARGAAGSDASDTSSGLLKRYKDIPNGYRPILICMTGSRKGVRHKIDKKHTIIGRTQLADFPIHESAASRRHARIIYENYDRPEEPPVCYIEDLESKNGTELNGREINAIAPLKERDRLMIGHTIFGYFIRDLAELMHDEFLYNNATRDPLTNLDNRQQMISHLKHFMARAQRRQTQFCFLVADVDHFKNINDTYGHLVGDEALKHLARLMQDEIRETDFIARWGGEEFAIGVADSTLHEATMLADRLREKIEANPLKLNELALPLTVSIGVTSLQEGDTIDKLFQRADRYLYEAKVSARNKVVAGN